MNEHAYKLIQMINLQNSKKLLKTYDNLLLEIMPSKSSSKNMKKFNTTFVEQAKHKSFRESVNTQEQEMKQKQKSKMINIQFNEHQKLKQNLQIRMRRKMLTSSEKFYHQKKNAYSSYIKEIYQKINSELKRKNNFLTIGSHSIRKMDFTSTIFSKDTKLEIKNIRNLQEMTIPESKRIKHRLLELQQSSQRQTNQPIIKQITNQQVMIFNESFRKPFIHSEKQIKSKKIKSLRVSNTKSLNATAEEFIPIRKHLNKKEPFVFGMSEKQFSQKNKDRLLEFHDFLWKVNYSNGLYIKPSDFQTTFKAYVGPGNNSWMIKGILKRRFWWAIVQKVQGSNFAWTQLKNDNIFKQYQNQSKNNCKNKIIDKKQETCEENILFESFQNQTKQDGHEKVFNKTDLWNWKKHFSKNKKSESIINEKTYMKRVSLLNSKKLIKIEDSKKIVMHNHLEQNYFIGNKKALFYNMKKFYELQGKDVFEAIPLTFHIIKGIEDSQFKNFTVCYQRIDESIKNGCSLKNIWIMKPGENSNRGNGISVCYSLEDIRLRLRSKERNNDGNLRTFILQKYIENPLLYKGRKFDIRHYLLLTCFNGSIKAYWYPEGYIRTASAPFTLKRGTNLFIHLTNDAIQKNSNQYGKYEKGNKISYDKFQTYLHKTSKKGHIFYEAILPQMKQLTIAAIHSTYLTLDEKRREHNFELLGMDFMIDDEFKPWLIQINTNPCLELSSPLLARLIPNLVENAFKICVDPFFPPPEQWPANKKMFLTEDFIQENQFELIFDQSQEGEQVEKIFQGNYRLDNRIGKIEEDAQIYDNDGNEEWDNQNQLQ